MLTFHSGLFLILFFFSAWKEAPDFPLVLGGILTNDILEKKSGNYDFIL